VVILGGLVTSTALTLFVVPILYLRFGSASGDAVDDQRARMAAG
jgi:Cu/Ag efflux pump CusA